MDLGGWHKAMLKEEDGAMVTVSESPEDKRDKEPFMHQAKIEDL